MRGTDALVIPGTGVLYDTDGLLGWGPYDMFRWSVAAKLCRCRLLFVSVGAGPLDSRAGRFLVKAALSLADFRSYRDESTARYLEGIGFRTRNDRIYPDLVFSLPEGVIPTDRDRAGRRPVVGLGLMKASGKHVVQRTTSAGYSPYLESLAEFTEWLLSHDYDVRLLFGDIVDMPVRGEFRALLTKRSAAYGEERIIDEPIASVDDLLKQLAATDVLVATRFHNVLLALLLNKPVIALSYHHKCVSLMIQMGLSDYCHGVNHFTSGWLIEQFSQLQRDADSLKQTIAARVGSCRDMLDEQYSIILRDISPDRRRTPSPTAEI